MAYCFLGHPLYLHHSSWKADTVQFAVITVDVASSWPVLPQGCTGHRQLNTSTLSVRTRSQSIGWRRLDVDKSDLFERHIERKIESITSGLGSCRTTAGSRSLHAMPHWQRLPLCYLSFRFFFCFYLIYSICCFFLNGLRKTNNKFYK